MKNLLIALAFTLPGIASAAEAPMWVRDARISPDGSKVAFSYKGDIFTVPYQGGEAVRLTSGPSYESSPVWSPDGSRIAFASDRNGGRDVYVMSAEGGVPVRLTFDSTSEIPEAFSADGKDVIFSAVIQDPASSAHAPMRYQGELYRVPADGGRVTQVLAVPAVNLSVLPDGSFLYEDVKGLEDKWRKHHTSSVTRDIWIYNPANDTYQNLTSREGEDRNPALSAKGDKYYFLSERDGGSFNVYSSPLKAGARPTRLTDFKSHPVRFLSAGAGDRLAFVYDGELYTMQPGSAPRKMAINLTDDASDAVQTIPFSTVEGAVVSPDGKQVAYTVRGEVFVSSTEYPSIKQITHTPALEDRLSWGSDGRTLYYGSLRSGRSNIYKASIKRADDPNFSNATLIEETALFPDDGIERGYPSISPDGKKMAFVEDRRILKVMDLASKAVKTLSEDKVTNYRTGGYDVAWSPDSRWLTLEIMNPMHDPYGDIAMVDVETGEFISLTNTGYFDERPRFTADGNAVVFASERYGMRNHASWGSEYDVMMVFLNKEAYDKYRLSEEDFALLKEVEDQQKKAAKKTDGKKGSSKKGKASKDDVKKDEEKTPAVKIDREGIQERIVRLTPNSSDLSDFAISKDGSDLYYLSAFEQGYDLWKRDLRKGDVSLVKKLDSDGSRIQADSDGNLWLTGSTVKKFNPKSKETKNVSLRGKVKIDPALEREAMLDYVSNEARERFYLPEMPIDWDAYVAAYRRFLPHINNNYDFADLLSELLGELNVSHSGGRYYPDGATDPTASLGLLFDMRKAGDGLVVDEIVAGGPFDRATTRVRPGDVVESINGEKITSDADWEHLLNNTARRKTLVSLYSPASGERWEEVVLPISAGAMNELLYRRWIKSREEAVDSLSGGRLGYLHLRSMSDDSFRDIYSKLLGKYFNKEGVVIDTRWNGGGRLHEDIEVLFSGEKYLTQEVHGRPTGEMPSRRWNKPSVMITGEANYSNAHGTPWVYRYKKLGKIVGMPVPGTMSSVNWITLQDPSLVFGVPVVAFRTAEGNVLENTQLEPDIKVANRPEDVVRGRDAQLETAVRSLLTDIDARKVTKQSGK